MVMRCGTLTQSKVPVPLRLFGDVGLLQTFAATFAASTFCLIFSISISVMVLFRSVVLLSPSPPVLIRIPRGVVTPSTVGSMTYRDESCSHYHWIEFEINKQ